MFEGHARVTVWHSGEADIEAIVFNVPKERVEKCLLDAIEGMLMEPDAFRE